MKHPCYDNSRTYVEFTDKKKVASSGPRGLEIAIQFFIPIVFAFGPRKTAALVLMMDGFTFSVTPIYMHQSDTQDGIPLDVRTNIRR